jgi:hypothetical protein
VLFPPQFEAIQNIRNTPVFITSTEITTVQNKSKVKVNDETAFEETLAEKPSQNGVYDAEFRRWLVDSTGFKVHHPDINGDELLLIEDLKRHKYGLMDIKGQFIVPIAYDSIIYDKRFNAHYLKNKNKYQIFGIEKDKMVIQPTKYEGLTDISLDYHNQHVHHVAQVFLAKKQGKWGVIDGNEKVILPFEYDYAAAIYDELKSFVLIKNGQARSFAIHSLPNEMPSFPHVQMTENKKTSLKRYALVDDEKRSFFINDTGKVILPPDYQLIEENLNSEYALVKDAKNRKKLVFLGTGAVVDFPFEYQIVQADQDSRLIIVKDTARLSYGVVSTDGKLLMPCNNYGVAIADAENATFFVKHDAPIINEQSDAYKDLGTVTAYNDSLTVEDVNWRYFDGKGKQIGDKPFSFPIDFRQGIGVGHQDGVFHLYRNDGSILTPFAKKEAQKGTYTEGSSSELKIKNSELKNGATGNADFQNILRDDDLGYYSLFYTQGLTPMLQVAKPNGEIIVESGRYDGISRFYDQYALVKSGEKVGLIDTTGQEIIKPQDLYSYTGHFMDILRIYDRREREKSYDSDGTRHEYKKIALPVELSLGRYGRKENPEDSHYSEFQKAALWNLMLEQTTVLKTVSDTKIPRVRELSSAETVFRYNRDEEMDNRSPFQIETGDSTIGFILLNQLYQSAEHGSYHNFYRKNGRWEPLDINDWLMIQGEKRQEMNDLIIKKIRLLDNAQIDCSNIGAFVEIAQNQWLITSTGLSFYFAETGGSGRMASIALSWNDLKPFEKFSPTKK